jgi:DNA repair protein SbcD/Mre11
MKFLHTADWHVGKTLKGRDRLDEQRAVLAEIASIAEANEVDAVLVAGDVYDLSAPSAPAQQLVVQALLRMRRAGAEVIVIAGNHDHGPTFEAYRPLMGVAGITLAGTVRPADRGGVIRFTARSDGADTQVAVLPFLSQRYAVRAAEIVANTPSENVRAYDEQVRQVIGSLTGSFSGDTVNLVMSHITCVGGKFGGGERSAQSIFEYSVPASVFPVSAHYVALGHLHRRQALPAPAPVHYSGAPLAVDFGEQDNASVVCLVEAAPGVPARISDIPVTAGRRLRTVHGTLAELEAQAGVYGDDYLRVYLREPTRAGLRDDAVEILPNALEVRIDPEFAPQPEKTTSAGEARTARTPGQLFADYCATRDVSDPRVAALFGELHDEVTASGGDDSDRGGLSAAGGGGLSAARGGGLSAAG